MVTLPTFVDWIHIVCQKDVAQGLRVVMHHWSPKTFGWGSMQIIGRQKHLAGVACKSLGAKTIWLGRHVNHWAPKTFGWGGMQIIGFLGTRWWDGDGSRSTYGFPEIMINSNVRKFPMTQAASQASAPESLALQKPNDRWQVHRITNETSWA